MMGPCSHVTCRTCVDTLVRPSMQCIVCDKQLTKESIIQLKREGMQCKYDYASDTFLKDSDRDWLCWRRISRNIENRHSFPGLISVYSYLSLVHDVEALFIEIIRNKWVSYSRAGSLASLMSAYLRVSSKVHNFSSKVTSINLKI